MVAGIQEKGMVQTKPIEGTAPRIQPVHFWAVVGVIIAAMIVYIWGSWITGPYFKPTPVGVDEPSMALKIWVRTVEALSLMLWAVCIYYFVYRPWRREGKLGIDGVMCICCWTMWVQDPLLNYTNFWYMFNSYFINFGCWVPYYPGTITPNTNLMPEAAVAWFCAYTWFGFAPVFLVNRLATWARKRWPNMGTVSMLLYVYLVFVLIEFLIEGSFTRTGLYAWGSCIPSLTIWSGELYQFPLYESFVFAFVWLYLFLLRYFRDDKGRTFVERGIDKVKASRPMKSAMRFFAVLGFVHLAYLAGYNIPIQWFAMHGDKFVEGYPSYLTCGIAGPGTPYQLTAPDVPIPREESLTNKVCPPEEK